jgi:hypothetical protein
LPLELYVNTTGQEGSSQLEKLSAISHQRLALNAPHCRSRETPESIKPTIWFLFGSVNTDRTTDSYTWAFFCFYESFILE